MKLNQLMKSMLVAMPLLAITACSSTSGTDSSADTTNQGGNAGIEQGSDVQTGGLEAVLTPEEQQRQKFEEMRKEHIIYFDFDRSDVNSQFADLLQAHAEYLVQYPNVSVLIEGHADERGTPEYNIALGERRAKAVAKYLQGLGVQSNQIGVVSYGEEKPLDVSRSEAAHAKNRRAVLVY
ncbi:peptidoglycan-associated lipoprotein Pal [Paraferrimonas sedimenticola]|uniref:Peptidoglycan-associated lipoprotein n=1 Tax=Paraferrimonas sedimenticola TaxID=375674 RepID=A0AA37RYS1_9GAMM|nr:peptidoglycan-associated lipoprotein Pal [Paraferrimonas sedimenticola]GLP97965.1 peptidoglycan-associated lipoprotein [Paraferrimonas sedimenticola]